MTDSVKQSIFIFYLPWYLGEGREREGDPGKKIELFFVIDIPLT